MLNKEKIQQTINTLEDQGLLRKTGELKRGVAGNLQPVYALTTVGKWLAETGLVDDFQKWAATPEEIDFYAKNDSNQQVQ